MSDPRPFGPKTADHWSIGQECPACHCEFAEGDYTTLVFLGPGEDEDEQERARAGRVYNAVAVEVHWTCATGWPDDVAKEMLGP
jgi:hypothetical protein